MATLPASPPFIPADTGYVSSGSRARGRSGAIGSLFDFAPQSGDLGHFRLTSTVSSFSCGRTSRNQPTHPVTAEDRSQNADRGARKQPGKEESDAGMQE